MHYTKSMLEQDLTALGVSQGDLLFVHASFKNLGPVEGGVATVVSALESVSGPEGLLLMPSFNLVSRHLRASTWNIATTPSTVGWLTEYFRTMTGTVRSEHYSHSVAARGKNAAEFVSGHLSNEGMFSHWDLPPWGKTYGKNSPMLRAYEAGGKVLMLGVDYHSSTYIHVVEVMLLNENRLKNPSAIYIPFDRERLGAEWDSMGRLKRGRVGDADCRLFPIRDFVDSLLQLVRRNPEKWMPPQEPGC